VESYTSTGLGLAEIKTTYLTNKNKTLMDIDKLYGGDTMI